MTNSETKSPAELRAERFDDLRSEWASLSGKISLGYLDDEIEDRAGQMDALPLRIADLRKRGYRYNGDWEARVASMSEGWPERRRRATRLQAERARSLKAPAAEIDELCDHSMLSDSALDRLESGLEQLEAQLEDAERAVRGAYDSLDTPLYELQREFDAAEDLLESIGTASFDFYPDENGVAVCKATWTNHPDEPEGLLFLTDGRLVFEQREKKAKKKVLFITTESELVQELLWETPVGNVEELEAEDKRKMLSRKELLHLGFREYASSSGLHGDVTLQLKGASNEAWAGLIKRVQSGEIEADRFDAPSPAEAAAAEAASATPPREIPTKCPACGGQLPQLVKGMRELVCEYCGTVVRL